MFSPLDIALYNLTVISPWELDNVVVGTDGLGSNLIMFLNDTFYPTLEPFQQIFFLMLGNPICPPGNITFNITFSLLNHSIPFFKVPVEIQMYPNRGRIDFDM